MIERQPASWGQAPLCIVSQQMQQKSAQPRRRQGPRPARLMGFSCLPLSVHDLGKRHLWVLFPSNRSAKWKMPLFSATAGLWVSGLPHLESPAAYILGGSAGVCLQPDLHSHLGEGWGGRAGALRTQGRGEHLESRPHLHKSICGDNEG